MSTHSDDPAPRSVRPTATTIEHEPGDGGSGVHGNDRDASLPDLVWSLDWSKTPIGAVESWSPTLRTMVRFLLANRFPLLLWWGPDYVSIYNDAYRPILGSKHPDALGKPFRDVWPEIRHVLQPLIDAPFQGGEATWADDIELEINRNGFTEESHFTIAYSPVPDDAAPRGIGGVLATVNETTEKVVADRRIAVLRDLGARGSEAKTPEEAVSLAADALARHAKDIPFVLVYLIETDGETATLAASTGIGLEQKAALRSVRLAGSREGHMSWPFAKVAETRASEIVTELRTRLARVPRGPWSDPPAAAVVMPLSTVAHGDVVGFVVAGASPRLRLDDAYCAFLDLVAAQISASLANARAYQIERERAEKLAEIDRAKTVFFSNISHEFRTPLSLILGPLTDALTNDAAVEGSSLEMAHRNSLRLLKLVNSLLDFSRIEAGRASATYQATDLGQFTAALASNFRSACDQASLSLDIGCPTLAEVAYVDRDMWEKIVLNLISNAFKFTFVGGISVSLHETDGMAELRVSDTGVGIPDEEMPRLFERFHRIDGQRSRTHEGSGIGLALVAELVKLHGGSISADSEQGKGTTFTVRIPIGSAKFAQEKVASQSLPSTSVRADVYVQEALRWLPDAVAEEQPAVRDLDEPDDTYAIRRGDRVLVVDDNADMRDYLRRLLAARCDVQTVTDGSQALANIKRERPSLVLTDVMMPVMDGFQLLREIRADPELRDIPVILLSARAGEGSRVEALASGADDYLVKPFSARELIARVGANLQLARFRTEAADAIRESEARYGALVAASSYVVYRMNRDWSEMVRLEGRGVVADSEEPTQSWLEQYVHEDDHAAVRAEIDRAIAEKRPFESEHRMRRLDGTLGWTLSRAVPTLDAAGEIREWFGAASDVSERKRAEETLRTLNETLEQRVSDETAQRARIEEVLRQSQKMEAIGQLTGGLAHDFNNLLAAVGGAFALIERRLVDGRPGIDRYLRAGQDAVRRAATLTQRLLAFSRQQNLDPKPLDANKLILGIEELLRRTVGPQIELKVIGAERLWPIKVDAQQLESSLLNLCINARDAMMPDGGTLTVETANRWFDARSAGERDLPAGEYVAISVTDTGSGMTPEVKEKAFDPFFTTKPIGKGTGLGLSMVYGFLRQSGGQVRIRSEPGQGTTMVLYLPRHLGEAEEREIPSVAPDVHAGAGETVLVVDDEPTLRMLICDVLEDHGYRVLLARDGPAALRVLETAVPIDLMISDVGLPGGMNGRQMANEARKLRPRLKVLFLTGFAESAVVGQGHLAQDMEVMTKPFEISSLAAKACELIGQA